MHPSNALSPIAVTEYVVPPEVTVDGIVSVVSDSGHVELIIVAVFVVVYFLTLFLGIVSRPSWNKVNRNKIYNNFDNEKEGEEK